MIRRRPEEDEDNPERWLVSYADFITLLFAFFVVMYSISSVNQNKYKTVSSSITTAFISKDARKEVKNPTIPSQKHDPAGNSKTLMKEYPLTPAEIKKLQEERESMTNLGINLSNNLSPLIRDGKIRVAQTNRGIRIDINDSLLFSPGSAELAFAAKEILSDITELVQETSHAIQVEGHTDNTPIHNALFYSNWELSAVRATSVVRMFSELGIADNRLSASGYGDTQPVASNDTPEGRAKNRHVSVVILYDRLSLSNDSGTEIAPTETSH
jgi:chemotaxis protein MotB